MQQQVSAISDEQCKKFELSLIPKLGGNDVGGLWGKCGKICKIDVENAQISTGGTENKTHLLDFFHFAALFAVWSRHSPYFTKNIIFAILGTHADSKKYGNGWSKK